MRKRILPEPQSEAVSADDAWLALEELADVEITSENPAHPIEAALIPGRAGGWRAATPGRQTIRLIFKQPQRLRRIRLRFFEPNDERTQEYVVRWSDDGGRSFREVVRQQWNFSPRGATSQTEDHEVELPRVTVLEASIVPDTSGGAAIASLGEFRVA
jgi:hypothetical protein